MPAPLPWTAIDWPRHLREARVGDQRLAYVDYGEGPVVLLVHGMAGSWQSWLTNIPALAADHRVIAIDLPGFGGSQPLAKGATFETYVELIIGLLDELEIEHVAVLGHSFGGLVALTLASNHPARVCAVVLMAGGGVELSRVRLAAIRIAFFMMRIALSVPGSVRLLRRRRVARCVLWLVVHNAREIPAELARELMPASVGRGFMDAVRLGSGWLGRVDLRLVLAPVLLVWGSEDRILPVEVGQRLAVGLTRGRLVVLDAVGHCPMFERAEESNQLILTFLEPLRDPWERCGEGTISRSWAVRPGNAEREEWCGDGAAG